jgi:hypothetical protein
MMQFNSVPTIDLQPLWSDDSEAGIKNVAAQLKEKLAPAGFAYIINHQIPEELLDKVFKESVRFHALPLETKMKIKQNEFFRGYLPNKTSQVTVSTEGIAKKPNNLTSFVTSFEVPKHILIMQRAYILQALINGLKIYQVLKKSFVNIGLPC